MFLQVSLTLMGDGPHISWRLLDIDILVEDKETGGLYCFLSILFLFCVITLESKHIW